MWLPFRQQIAETVLGPELRHYSESIKGLENQRLVSEATIAQLRQEVIDKAKTDYLWIGGEDTATQFDRATLGRIIAHCRALALKNPLVQRSLDVMALYCFGQGVSIEAESEGDKESLERLIDDPRNRAELFGPEGLEYGERELNSTGNLFYLLYGRRNGPGVPQVRSAPVEEFTEIVTNPADRKDIWLYLREIPVKDGTPRKVYHPDVMHKPANRQPTRDGIEILWDIPVAHYGIGGFSHWAWGLPKLYAAGDWATAYKAFLEDLATVIKSLSRYAHKLTVKGSPGQVTKAAVALRSSHVGGIDSNDTNPPPAAGSAFVQSEQANMEVFKASGMHVDGDSGRRLMLMFAAGMGLPETFFADLSNSNLATAKALDRPTELLFLMRQTLWKRILADIAGWGVTEQRRAGSVTDPNAQLPVIKVDFPPILEHDVAKTVTAMISALTLDGKKIAKLFHGAEREGARLLLQALGVDDSQQILDDIEAAGGFETDDTPEPQPPMPGQPPQAQPDDAQEARIIQAFQRIREGIEKQERS